MANFIDVDPIFGIIERNWEAGYHDFVKGNFKVLSILKKTNDYKEEENSIITEPIVITETIDFD